MSIKNLIVFILTGGLLILSLGFVASLAMPDRNADIQAINAANQLYQAGHYPEAAQVYEGLISQGLTDSTLYYNLGNSYFQMGDLGMAILNYQRAALSSPRDADIRANLELVSAQAGLMPPDLAPGPLFSLANWSRSWLTMNETALLTLGMWFTFSLLLIVYLQTKPGSLRAGIRHTTWIALFLVLLSVFTLGTRLYTERRLTEGVIIAPTVSVSASPDGELTTDLQLPGGTAVSLLEVRGEWAHMALPGRSVEGWVPIESIETLGIPTPTDMLTF
jgi:hypothetical protein